MKKRNVLVFPAGTEIGLEILHALEYCKEVRLFGAGQDVSNHAKFAYSEYHTLPSIHEEGWLECLVRLCQQLSIDYIFPAYDDVLVTLSQQRAHLPAVLIAPSNEACEITRSKSQTYRCLGTKIRVPEVYEALTDVTHYPVLVKPDRGQGSFGIHKACSQQELLAVVSSTPDAIICEYLPGDEYTVDCFSDRKHGVMFASARSRRRTRNGISVNTITEYLPEAHHLAETIHETLGLYGAWFFQLKRSSQGDLALLEVAPRIAGSMSTHRVMGVNFPLMSIFEHERQPLSILLNPGKIEVDRALGNRYRHTLKYGTLYVDLDDTLLVNGRINTHLVKLIFQCINCGKPVNLVTRHRSDLPSTLAQYRLGGLFDRVIHLEEGELKSAHITEADAIFIDDSFTERLEVAKARGIPTFDCSMIELLAEQAEFLNGDMK